MDLFDDIFCTLKVFFRHFGLHGIQHVHGAVAQEFYFGVILLNGCYYVFTALTTLVVSRRCQFVLNDRIQQYQTIAFGIEGEILVFQRTAVQTDE